MATYKLIQDIEAEDKILGPLTLRQFIFALIAVFLFYICFILLAKHAAFLLVLFLPPAVFFGFFALPFGRDQPTEIWALAKLHYWFKPRRRVWNSSGVKEMVTITAPKKVERVLSSGMSQTEVKSRLRALADTIDSRGWAVKNVNMDAYSPAGSMVGDSDRLIDVGSLPQPVPEEAPVPSDDILDETSNPIAQQFQDMISQSSQAHRQQLVDQLNTKAQPPAPANDYWFMNGTPAGQSTAAPAPAVSAKVDAAEEAAAVSRLKARAAAHPAPYGNLRTMKPLGPASPTAPAVAATGQDSPAPAVTAPADPAILSLADNDDLNVATIAREAKRAKDNEGPQDEVVVPLR